MMTHPYGASPSLTRRATTPNVSPKRKRGRFALLFVLVASAASPAADKPAVPTADAQDILYFSPNGPVRPRFQLQFSGKPVSARWNDFVGALMKHFDRDGDGKLDEKELAALSTLPLRDASNVEIEDGIATQRRAPINLADLDTDKDGKISRDELAAYRARTTWVRCAYRSSRRQARYGN